MSINFNYPEILKTKDKEKPAKKEPEKKKEDDHRKIIPPLKRVRKNWLNG